MTEKNFVKKYNGYAVEDWGCYPSDDFKTFARNFRNTLRTEMAKIGAAVAAFSSGHYDLFAFIKKNEKYIYVSYSCPRHGNTIDCSERGVDGVLYREAKNAKDYRGGSNHFCSIDTLSENLTQMFDRLG